MDSRAGLVRARAIAGALAQARAESAVEKLDAVARAEFPATVAAEALVDLRVAAEFAAQLLATVQALAVAEFEAAKSGRADG